MISASFRKPWCDAASYFNNDIAQYLYQKKFYGALWSESPLCARDAIDSDKR
jgi:hypothetical protein